MFGYVKIHAPELKMKDYYKYKAYYCGLCNTLKERHGHLGQMTLTYDMTFLIIFLTSLYESETTKKQAHCIVHPVKKHDMLKNEITEYVADMNIVLTYYHFMDDWQDEQSMIGLVGMKALKKDYMEISSRYPKQCHEIKKHLHRLQKYEKKKEMNIDQVSSCFGELMAELFLWRKDNWEPYVRKVGLYLGKFIYILDAYEDLEKDIKNHSYNPLIPIYHKNSNNETYEEVCNQMLTMMMAECTSEFEKLPCVLDIEILRNILYAGVWTKYNAIQSKKEVKEGTKK